MEIQLTLNKRGEVVVYCDNKYSHIFDPYVLSLSQLQDTIPLELADPIQYGRSLFQALFPSDSLAFQLLQTKPRRIALITDDLTLQAIPWEYAYSPNGFLVLDYPFVRGLPIDQRTTPLANLTSLHIISIPSNPLESSIAPLNIDDEWQQLKEIIQATEQAITLERSRPATLEQLRRLVIGKRNCIVHFMGHGDQREEGAVLLFENAYGGMEVVTARDFVRRVQDTVFLVTLNACVSAAPGSTAFSNLAAALAKQQVPYILGMQFSLADEDARTLSRVLYAEVANGSSVEQAVYQMRLELAKSTTKWAVGVPVLYTSLPEPAWGFAVPKGKPVIIEHQPQKMEVNILPRAEGAFQGRVEELQILGKALTGDSRPRILTIHGGGGMGKTALAREAVERFGYAWPGGVLAISLENLHDLWRFVVDLAQFLGLDINIIRENLVKTKANASLHEIGEEAQRQLERLVLARLAEQRTLLALDNAETLIERAENKDIAALELAQFIRQKLPGPTVSLLVTSRSHLHWTGEQILELGGVSPAEGARLFRQSAPSRQMDARGPLGLELSEKVGGHPLSLCLLGKAFNASGISLENLIEQYDVELMKAEDKYLKEDHRHRTLYASIDTSIHYLDRESVDLLSGLWIFRTPFLAESAVFIFDPDASNYTDEKQSSIYHSLQRLWQQGLLIRERYDTPHDGSLQLYRLLSPIRPYAEKFMQQFKDREELTIQFTEVYSTWVSAIRQELDHNAKMVYLARLIREDLEQALTFVQAAKRAFYLSNLGKIVDRLGDAYQGIKFLEEALEIAQGNDSDLEVAILYDLAWMYKMREQNKQALDLFQRALSIAQKVGDKHSEAGSLKGIADVYFDYHQMATALNLYEQALAIARGVGDKTVEGSTLASMGLVHYREGHPERALDFLQLALNNTRERQDRVMEATTLGNLALAFEDMGLQERALAMYQQALAIEREMDNRSSMISTLNNMGILYHRGDNDKRARESFHEALAIAREIDFKQKEATALANLAATYNIVTEGDQASEAHQQALSICREIGDRAGEASILNNMSVAYFLEGEYEKALEAQSETLRIFREIGDRQKEAATLDNISYTLLGLDHKKEALEYKIQVIALLEELGLTHTDTLELTELKDQLTYLQCGANLYTLLVINDVVNTMNTAEDKRGESRERADKLLQRAVENNDVPEADFCYAIFDILGGQEPRLPPDHAFAPAIATIQSKIMTSSKQQPGVGAQEFELEVFIRHTISAMTGGKGELEEWRRKVDELACISKDKDAQQEADFFAAVLALIDGQTPDLPKNHVYSEALDLILTGITTHKRKRGALPEDDLNMLIEHIILSMTNSNDTRNQWREYIQDLLQRAQSGGYHTDSEFFEAVLAILSSEDPNLPDDHPYAEAIRAIQSGIAGGGLRQHSVLSEELLDGLITNTIAVMTVTREELEVWYKQVKDLFQKIQNTQYQREADFLGAILNILDEQAPSLAEDHPYAASVTKIMKGIGEFMATILAQGFQAVAAVSQVLRAFNTAPDWDTKQRVVEAHQDLLFRPEVEGFLEFQLVQARATNHEETVEAIKRLLEILRQCKKEGISATFAKNALLEKSSLTDKLAASVIPADFVMRCAQGLTGSFNDKMMAYTYLQELSASDTNFRALIQVVQSALFGADLSTLGSDLIGIYADTWHQIMAQVL